MVVSGRFLAASESVRRVRRCESDNRQVGRPEGRPASSCRNQFLKRKIHLSTTLGGHEKQLSHRLPAPFVRHLLAQHRSRRLTARSAAAELGLKRARFYELYSDYLHACAHGQADTWSPGRSGGDHHADWSAAVTALLTKLLAADLILELCGANRLLDQLLAHTNQHETHRELGTTRTPPVTCP